MVFFFLKTLTVTDTLILSDTTLKINITYLNRFKRIFNKIFMKSNFVKNNRACSDKYISF